MKVSRRVSAVLRGFLLLALAFLSAEANKSQNSKSIAIYMGQKIAPYELVARELKNELSAHQCRVVSLEGLASVPPPRAGETIITIGQDAYKKLMPLKGPNPLVYTMVLFPPQAENQHSADVMGVAMIPSPRQEFQILKDCMGLNSVTIFVNPAINYQFVSDMEKMAPKNLSFSLRTVSSEKQFLNMLDDDFPESDAILLVPEPTVLTEQGLKKLVRRSYEEKKPIIGFAPMYIELGAALSLSVSETLTAKVAARIIEGDPAEWWDRADGLCYSKLCELRIARTAAERFRLKVDSTRFSELGCEFKEAR